MELGSFDVTVRLPGGMGIRVVYVQTGLCSVLIVHLVHSLSQGWLRSGSSCSTRYPEGFPIAVRVAQDHRLVVLRVHVILGQFLEVLLKFRWVSLWRLIHRVHAPARLVSAAPSILLLLQNFKLLVLFLDVQYIALLVEE